MSPFQVPQAPPQVQAQSGARGGVIPPNPSLVNRNKASQIVTGLQQLMQGFVGMKQATEKHYGDKLDAKMQELANGLDPNPDWNEIMKWAKKSNRGYKTDLTPAEAQQQTTQFKQSQFQQSLAQAQQNQQAMSSQASGLPGQAPGAMGSPGQPGMPAPGVAMPPAPQAAPPGMLQRMMMAMGGNRPGAQTSASSPFGQQLQGLAAAGQVGGGMAGDVAAQRGLQVLQRNVQRAAGQLGIAHDQSQIPVYSQLFQKALGGDVDSMTMLRRLKVMDEVPVDTVASIFKAEAPGVSDAEANAKSAKLLLWQQGGGPALQLKLADLSKDMVPRFGGNADAAMRYVQGLYSGNSSGLTPGMTAEEFKNFADGSQKILDRYPAAPAGLADMYSQAKLAGRDGLSTDILDFLNSHYKNKGQIDQSQFQQRIATDRYSTDVGAASSNYRTGMEAAVGNRRVDVDALGQYTKAFEALDEPTKAILNNPNAEKEYTADQLSKAREAQLNMMNNLAGQTFTDSSGQRRQLAPYNELLNRNNITTDWTGPGPRLQHNVMPSVGPAPVPQGLPMNQGQAQSPASLQAIQQMMLQGGQLQQPQ